MLKPRKRLLLPLKRQIASNVRSREFVGCRLEKVIYLGWRYDDYTCYCHQTLVAVKKVGAGGDGEDANVAEFKGHLVGAHAIRTDSHRFTSWNRSAASPYP
jgi:hypothetical protein